MCAKLSSGVFLAVFGAMGDCGYGAVLVSAVGEFATVWQTLGLDGHAVAFVVEDGLMLAAFVKRCTDLTIFVHLVFGVELGRRIKRIVDIKTPHLAEF